MNEIHWSINNLLTEDVLNVLDSLLIVNFITAAELETKKMHGSFSPLAWAITPIKCLITEQEGLGNVSHKLIYCNYTETKARVLTTWAPN